jgi:hypothetical protein
LPKAGGMAMQRADHAFLARRKTKRTGLNLPRITRLGPISPSRTFRPPRWAMISR